MKFDEWNLQEYRTPSKYSDFRYAADLAGLDVEQVKHLMACVPGEADGPDWHWVYILKNDKYGYMYGGCDYTGWDCQAGAQAEEYATLDDLLEKIGTDLDKWDKKRFDERKIKEQLTKQINGEQPYALDNEG